MEKEFIPYKQALALKELGAKRLREIASELEKEAEYLCQ